MVAFFPQRTKAALRMWMVAKWQEIFSQGLQNAALWKSSVAAPSDTWEDLPKIKRERGDTSPRTFSRFTCLLPDAALSSGGQNLAALSAATGQNLTAVGSSHSLAETMHLGTMALGGLIGTLHLLHLPVLRFSCRNRKWPQQSTIYSHTWVL
jgi:hypothetical protein